MKKPLILLALILLFGSCSADEDSIRNPYLPDIDFALQLDLTLPQYDNLNFPGNSFTTYNYGINGIVVYNLNSSQYLAFELTDPSHVRDGCSLLTVNGLEAVCSCDDENVYSIITGQLLEGTGEYSLKPYRIQRRGSILEISN